MIMRIRPHSVQLNNGNTLALKPTNVHQLCEVMLTGLEGRADLNSARGQIIGWDEAKQRYQILVHGKVHEKFCR